MKELKSQVMELQQALKAIQWELRRLKRYPLLNHDRISLLRALAVECYKSIVHRQWLMIQLLEAEQKFDKEAA